MSLNRWMVKQTTLCIYHGILLNNKKEWIIDMHSGLESSQGHYAVWKKPFQKVTYYMVPSIQPPHNDKFIVMERDYWLSRFRDGGERGMGVFIKGEQEDNLCSDEIVVYLGYGYGYTNVHMW